MANAAKVTAALCLLLLLSSIAKGQENPLKIVTSIKPLTLLVKAVAPESAQVFTLVPAGASPHTFQMRPSDRRALADADVVFWIGPELETFLQRTLANPELAPKANALMPDQSEDAQPEHHHENDSHDHQHDGSDPHVWLDPTLALAMTNRIRSVLSGDSDVGQEAMKRRFNDFKDALEKKEAAIRAALGPIQSISLFTYHDALRRFANHYDLEIAGALTPSPETSPGARHLNDIQQQLKNTESPCLLTEPQFNRDWWRNLTDNFNMQLSVWDPLAGAVPETADGYIQFQQAVADAVLKCLAE